MGRRGQFTFHYTQDTGCHGGYNMRYDLDCRRKRAAAALAKRAAELSQDQTISGRGLGDKEEEEEEEDEGEEEEGEESGVDKR